MRFLHWIWLRADGPCATFRQLASRAVTVTTESGGISTRTPAPLTLAV